MLLLIPMAEPDLDDLYEKREEIREKYKLELDTENDCLKFELPDFFSISTLMDCMNGIVYIIGRIDAEYGTNIAPDIEIMVIANSTESVFKGCGEYETV